MRKASGGTLPAATGQRAAIEYTEGRERGRQALPPGRVGCVCQQDSQHLHHTAIPLCCILDIQGR